MTIFRANGKLLLTGEYFILDGIKGLALPTKYGQELNIESSVQKGIAWKSIDHENNIWFEAQFDERLEILNTTDNAVAERLSTILSFCSIESFNLQLTTTLDFPNNWGLGSSSTLISLLSRYFKIDPYELLQKTFGGSGYDIACATANGPITYQLENDNRREIKEVDFSPSFTQHLYFIHLGNKQDSREGIKYYKNLPLDKSEYAEELSHITTQIIAAAELDEFCYYLEVHENMIARLLKMEKVKDLYFSDFPGTVKSLGAWGGDFVLVASDESPLKLQQYFYQKGFPVFISYDAMIL